MECATEGDIYTTQQVEINMPLGAAQLKRAGLGTRFESTPGAAIFYFYNTSIMASFALVEDNSWSTGVYRII